ncbi:NADH-quinone oxidoreductase subunit NuoF [Prosthecochloris sp. SCSIO W1101]|uniref:NADH-quinone oxidoreductase subunit NuoF n=1 Tax=Prosthecochloris sp. SCSIO W1101 TaxID=2992242 RepID=UPI00223D984B|nr:NADH-quinone oxidoreductase subunit NuoF [Prosthecochloris sp. SCSIO W1101]UZJ40989.1 NADH-quinone oxidoreductase subunit NuoF [Prosthecochloris sp. SCSIO W1101]
MSSQPGKPLTIIVGEGTCGIAAGAKEVCNTFRSLAPDAEMKTVGCVGMCHQEVMVEIIDEKGDAFLYGKVDKKSIPSILGFHQGEGDLQTDHLLRSSMSMNGADYLTRQTRIVLRNVGQIDPKSFEEYRKRGGYNAVEKMLENDMSPEQVIEEVKTAGIRGRGGAGFPTAVKWNFARSAEGDEKYLICNGDEGDPGAFMDRSLLEGDPHNVLEGMLIAAYAIGATKGYAYIRAEYPLAVEHFGKAIEDAREAGFLGKKILGYGFDFDVKIKQGAGAFVCGEETALIASIEGKRGMPRIRPPFPAVKGLFGKPTIINNVETLANLPWIIENRGSAYAEIGTEQSRGTKVFALAGAIKRGGLVEVPMGMTIRQVLYDIGGGSSTGFPIKAVQLGGPSGGCIPESLFDTPIEYEALNATGAIMGSGGMIVMDTKSCMVDIARYFLEFTQIESCGKCTFCRIGTLRMNELLSRICDGEGTMEDIDTLEEVAHQVKSSSLCGLGQTAPNPVLTTLKYFRDEYIAHVEEKQCPAGVCKGLITHTIMPESCTGCSICQRYCPVDAITGVVKKPETWVIDMELCINCGMCVEVCNSDAIRVQ